MTYDSVLTALADPTRRSIVERLAEGPAPVGELARSVPVSRPAVSQHLKVLKDAGLVSVTEVGSRRVYALDPGGAGELRSYLDRFWGLALHSFKRHVESRGGSPND
jgi:DNA-binding transcriptional ArsR family regulator